MEAWEICATLFRKVIFGSVYCDTVVKPLLRIPVCHIWMSFESWVALLRIQFPASSTWEKVDCGPLVGFLVPTWENQVEFLTLTSPSRWKTSHCLYFCHYAFHMNDNKQTLKHLKFQKSIQFKKSMKYGNWNTSKNNMLSDIKILHLKYVY